MCNTTKKNYSVQTTYTTTHFMPLYATRYLTYVKLHTTTKLPLNGKKSLCFLINKNNPRLKTFLYYSPIYVLPEIMTRKQVH